MVEMERDNEQGPEDLYIEVCGKGLSRITIGTAPAEYEYYLRTDRASEMRTCLIAWSNVLYGALGDDLIPLDAEVVVRMAENIRSVSHVRRTFQSTKHRIWSWLKRWR